MKTPSKIIDSILPVMDYLYEIGYDDAYDNLLFIKEIYRHYDVKDVECLQDGWGMTYDQYVELMSLMSSLLD